MFLRRNLRVKDGKVHTYWDLVESVRTVRGPRHRRVAYLGELTPSQKKGWAELRNRLEEPTLQTFRQASFIEEKTENEEVPETVEVKIGGVHVERPRDFGDVWLAWSAWKALGLDTLLAEIMPSGKEEIPWACLVGILSLGRICSPGSELHTAQTWYPQSALPDLFGVKPEQVYPMRLYRALDVLLPHKSAIETHLKARLGDLFKAKYELVLYDITSTYFEGLSSKNDLAQRGCSRDQRPDCKQVCLALLTTEEGLPFGYEIFAGNRVDVTTVEEIVEKMEKLYGTAGRIWVMDRGMVSEENIEFLQEHGASYLVGTPKSMLRRFEKELLSREWKEVQEGVEVRLCEGPGSKEVFVLCRSRDRTAKEKAMHERFAARIETALTRLAGRLKKARKKAKADVVNRQIGRFLGRNSRAAGLFEVHVEESRERSSGLTVTWTRRPEWARWAELSEGCYLLRTNLLGLSAETLWRTYMHLTDVEDSFRTIKTGLDLRPIWHQKRSRVEAHILIAFVAYATWKTIQQWMKQAGLGSGVQGLLNEIRSLKAVDVLLPTSTGQTIRIPCVSTPEKPLQVLLQRLGISPPRRLASPRWVSKALSGFKM